MQLTENTPCVPVRAMATSYWPTPMVGRTRPPAPLQGPAYAYAVVLLPTGPTTWHPVQLVGSSVGLYVYAPNVHPLREVDYYMPRAARDPWTLPGAMGAVDMHADEMVAVGLHLHNLVGYLETRGFRPWPT